MVISVLTVEVPCLDEDVREGKEAGDVIYLDLLLDFRTLFFLNSFILVRAACPNSSLKLPLTLKLFIYIKTILFMLHT